MKKFLRIALVPVVATAMLAFLPSSADAQTVGAAVVQGNGTISPGVDLTPTNQNFTFTSVSITVAGVQDGNVVPGASSDCSANGGSIVPETTANGLGTGTWSCSSGPLAGMGGSLVYARAGAAVAVAVTGDLNGPLACAFVPTAGDGVTSPVTAYDLHCGGAGAGL